MIGKKSSVTFINEQGEKKSETLTIERQDFWTTTSNKQLNFVQHVYNWKNCTGTPCGLQIGFKW